MKNARSIGKQKSINTFHYAVCPIAFEFDRQYTHNYCLYFQKNMQILGRYQINPKIITKNNRYYFQSPTAIQFFRIISENNLQFKWSVYKQKTTDNQRHQQHLESKKANLRWCWKNYEQYQENVQWIQIIFSVVKLKFYYLFVLGETHQTILHSVLQYYKSHKITPSKYAKQIQDSQKSQAIKSLENLPELSYKMSETAPVMLKSISNNSQPSEDVFDSKGTPVKAISSIYPQQDKMLQSQNRYFPQSEKKNNKQFPSIALTLKELSKLNLTTSQIQISKDIQKHLQDALKQSHKLLQQHSQPQLQKKESRKNRLVSLQSLQKSRHITRSQFLNQNNEIVIQPFYSSSKYWVILVTVLIIFVILINMGPKAKKRRIIDTHHLQPSHNQQHDEDIEANNHKVHKKKPKNKQKEKNKKEASLEKKRKQSKNKR